LHVTPESHVGGPLALVREGDLIELDVVARKLNLLVPEAELAQRRAAWVQPPSKFKRGYGVLYAAHIQQADVGCDFDFLETDYAEPGQQAGAAHSEAGTAASHAQSGGTKVKRAPSNGEPEIH
jgi:Dehydratase family